MGKLGILFCHLSRSKPYVVGTNLMTLDAKGRHMTVLRGAKRSIPERVVRFLFGDFTQVYLLAPGQTVELRWLLNGVSLIRPASESATARSLLSDFLYTSNYI